jgi:hypothetical protein
MAGKIGDKHRLEADEVGLDENHAPKEFGEKVLPISRFDKEAFERKRGASVELTRRLIENLLNPDSISIYAKSEELKECDENIGNLEKESAEYGLNGLIGNLLRGDPEARSEKPKPDINTKQADLPFGKKGKLHKAKVVNKGGKKKPGSKP